MVHAAFRGCVDAHEPCDCPWPGLSPEVMLMCIIWGSMMISEVHASPGENVGVRVLYCCWEPSWCRWPALTPMVMMVPMVHAASEGPVDIYIVCTATGDSAEVCGSCCCQKPLGRP